MGPPTPPPWGVFMTQMAEGSGASISAWGGDERQAWRQGGWTSTKGPFEHAASKLQTGDEPHMLNPR